jgi:hypothetical protein
LYYDNNLEFQLENLNLSQKLNKFVGENEMITVILSRTLISQFFFLICNITILNLNTKFIVFHVELKTSFGNITSNKTLGFWKMVKLFMDGSDWLTLPQAEANGDQKYVLHAQTNPSPNLALPRWTHLQPDRSLLDRRKTLF